MFHVKRVFVKTISEKTGLHVNTIRRWCDRGWVSCERDVHKWRWFPDPDATIARIKGLMNGTIKLEDE